MRYQQTIRDCNSLIIITVYLFYQQTMKQPSTEEFSFQYYVDLGNNILGHIFINQDSDPYVESSKFCVKYSLPSIIVTILGDAIQKQIDQQKHYIYEKIRKQQAKKTQEINFSLKDWNIKSDTLETELKEEPQVYVEPPTYERNPPSYERNPSSVDVSARPTENTRVFENLYNNYKEIQMKKQIQRKKSLENFTFKPQINHLSDKIVANKRKMNESSQKHLLNLKEPLQQLNDQRNAKFQTSHKPKLSYRVTLANTTAEKKEVSRQNSRLKVFHRNEMYQKKSEEKTKKLRDSLEKKIMDNCSFKPKINLKMR